MNVEELTEEIRYWEEAIEKDLHDLYLRSHMVNV